MAYGEMKRFVEEYRPKIDEKLYAFLERKVAEAPDRFNRRVAEDILRFARAGGKRLRPLLFILGYMGTGREPYEGVVEASISIELVHDYLLIHDDFMDGDTLRRGQDTVWYSLYKWLKGMGVDDQHAAHALAVCAGDLAETYGTEAILEANIPPDKKLALVDLLHRIIEQTGYGQVLDVSLEMLPLSDVREEDVLKVHEYKTSRYTVEGPLHLGATLADGGTLLDVYTKYAIPAGIAFQLRDDIIGVFGDEKVTGKPAGSDIREGKRTLLVVKAYERGTEEQRKRIEEILGKKDLTREELEEIREIIRETGSLEYSQELMERLVGEAKAVIESSDVVEPTRTILLQLADYMVHREK